MKTKYNILKNIGLKRLLRFLPIIVFTMFLSQTTLAQSPLCASSPTNFCCEYISSVNINGNVTTGDNGYSGPGYFDYTGTTIASLVAGQTYPISVTVQTNYTYHEYVKIWFDFNGNSNLQDPGELIFNQDASWDGTHTFSGTFTVPTNAYNGNVYLRVNMVYSVTPALCGSYQYGNTMDYKAAISGGVTPRTLTVAKAGTAGYIGDVTSSPSGINTALGINSANFADGSAVTLIATNASNGSFVNWTGNATGTNNTISVAMDANKSVTANFAAPLPIISNVSGTTTICAGNTTVLTAASTANSPVFNWYNAASGGNLLFTGTSYTTPTLSANAVYYISVTNSDGNTSTSRTATTVTVNALPTVSIAGAGSTSICSNGSVVMNATALAGSGTINSYNWLNGTTAASGGSNTSTYTASGAGNYSVLVTNSNGCTAISNVVPVTIMASTTPVFSNGNIYLQYSTSANSCDTLASYPLSVSGTPTPTVTYVLTGATIGNGSGTGSGVLYSKGVTNVTVTATNMCGATASTNFNVTVSDNVKPVMATKNATVYLDATGNASVKTSDVDNGSHDNCGAVTLSLQNSGTLCGTATENGTITLTAPTGTLITSIDFASYGTPTGSCGNYALGGCNASNSLAIVKNLALNKNSATITASNGVFGDPCNLTVKNMNIQATYFGSSSNNTFTCSQMGNNTVTLVATDVNGNANSQTATVNVVDSTRPIVLTQNYTVTLDATGKGTIAVANINNGSTDNCGIQSLALSTTSFNYTNIGNNIVTLAVTDNSGNVGYGTAVVTVLAKGLNANGQIVIDQSTQVNQYGAKGSGLARTAFGQVFGTSLPANAVGQSAYTLDCAVSSPALGSYYTGLTMTNSNTKAVTLNVTATGPCSLSTPVINGVSFGFNGTFTTTGSQSVILVASGSPIAAGAYTYPISGAGQICAFNVTVTKSTFSSQIAFNGSASATNGTITTIPFSSFTGESSNFGAGAGIISGGNFVAPVTGNYTFLITGFTSNLIGYNQYSLYIGSVTHSYRLCNSSDGNGFVLVTMALTQGSSVPAMYQVCTGCSPTTTLNISYENVQVTLQ